MRAAPGSHGSAMPQKVKDENDFSIFFIQKEQFSKHMSSFGHIFFGVGCVIGSDHPEFQA